MKHPRRLSVFALFAALAFACSAGDYSDRFPAWDSFLYCSFNRGDASDRSQANATGTLTNGASIGNNTWTTLDGTNDYVDFGNVSDHNSYPITISTWFNMQSQDQVSYGTCFGRYVSGSLNGWAVAFDTSERVGGFYFKSSGNYTGDLPNLISSASYKDASWHHVAMVVDASGSLLYVDGALVDTHVWIGTAGATTTATTTRLGGHSHASFYPFKGDLDQAEIHARALTAAEVAAKFAAGRR